MKRIFSLLLTLLLVVGSATASNIEDVVNQSLREIESRNPYRVEFEVVYADDSISGYYEVDKDNYYISIDQQELYGNSSEKYEVYNSRKEIVIDNVATSFDGNILNNPAKAFQNIRDHYTCSLISENESFVMVNLKPKSSSNQSDRIELKISKSTKLPVAITYIIGEDSVEIKVKSLSVLTSSIASYNSGRYADYEVIDFR